MSESPLADAPPAGRTYRALTAFLVALATGIAGLVVAVPAAADTAPIVPGTPETIAADPLPTVQIDGVVWAQKIVGNTVYVGGSFANARPAGAAAGTNLTPRANLLAYNLQTGALVNSWNPGSNAQVLSLETSPDGSRLYVAGTFTQIAGQTRYRVAAFSTATGALIDSWRPTVNGRVDDIAATDTTVYLVGEFTSVGGAARAKVAAVSASTGAVLPFSATVEGGWGARSVVASPDASKIVISGSFESVNGSTNPGRGMAALDATTAELLPWAVNSVLRNGGSVAAMYSLSADADSVYGTGYDYGGSGEDGFEGVFRANWTDGSIVWIEDCHGDTYSAEPIGDVIYTAGHTHYCGNIGGFPQTDPWTFIHGLAFTKAPTGPPITPDPYGYPSYTGQPSPSLLHWYPFWDVGSYTGQYQAGWDIESDGDYVLYGGEFTVVAGRRQQGLVRFATKTVAPNDVGPTVQGGSWALSALSFRQGEIRLNWQANYDADNAQLHYALFRQDLGTTPVYETDLASDFWNRPMMSFYDRTVTGGQEYRYRIRATDPWGNSTQSDWKMITASATGASTDYDDTVLGDDPLDYWPLGEDSGTVAFDWGTGNDLALTSSVTRGVTGPNEAEASLASQFTGSSTSIGATAAANAGPQEFSVEAWFRSGSSTGGKIIGFGNRASGSSTSYDRHIYLDSEGRVTFGVYPGQVSTVTSPASYDDNEWHHVVGTLSAAGQVLYVDGMRVAQRTDTTSAQAYSGYWRVGGDNLGGWPSVGSGYLDGAIADVAVYGAALTRDEVNEHWVASGRTSTVNPAPTDSYGKAVYDADPELYWRLGESTGTTAKDAGRNSSDGTYAGDVTKGVTGALIGVPDTAARFAPTANELGELTETRVSSQRSYVNPTTYALEVWVKTSTTAGGKIIGFGNRATGLSNNYDRHVYMTPDGRLNFGTYTNTTNIITSPSAYNDDLWHHVVAQQSAAGMRLFVDGVEVASNSLTAAQNYTGYWLVGGDSGWAGANYFTGTIDEVAVYGAPLSLEQVQEHHSLGVHGVANDRPVAAFIATVDDLAVSFDASTASDSDGTIASYLWDFGDGTPDASGVMVSHTYTSPGDYTVTLTVTDDRGDTGVVQQTVSFVAPNVAPTAVFTVDVDHQEIAVSASSSSDSDGTIVTYEWTFGDGATATGVTASHTYAAPGDYEVTLTVTDDRGGVDDLTIPVTATPPPNVAPVAVLSVSVSGLGVSVDGGGSSDAGGSVVSYAWDFGDGGSGSGPTASHVYAAAGSYTVTLTVTDDEGETGSVSEVVEVAEGPAVETIALDDFGRSSASGWGSAEVGGAWTHQGGSASFSVSDGQGRIALNISDTRASRLLSVATDDVEILTTVSVDRTGAGYYASVIGRQVGSDMYSARLRFEANGVVRLYALRNESALANSFVLPGAGYAPGEKLTVRVRVSGTTPTVVSAKVWRASEAEPADWQVSGTDTTAALQQPGAIGLISYLSGSSATPTALLSVDTFQAATPE